MVVFMIDLSYAKQQFNSYLSQYDRTDDKIRLKIVHTYGVVEYSRQICERMRLPEEDSALAQLIGLLHDIGRFEQLRRFDSFEPDTMDHAAFGVQILFEEGKIRDFVQPSRWDTIIRTAIGRHSDFKLEGVLDERELLHAKLIRDADKLDNCRVKIEDSMETLLGVSEEEVGKTSISPEVMEQFMRRQSIYSPTRKTKMDYWVSYFAYYFDINFRETLQIIEEQRYVKRQMERIPYTNPDTAAKMHLIETILREYFDFRLHDAAGSAGA